MNDSLSAPVATTDRQGNTAYVVVVTHRNQWTYGVDCRGSFADSVSMWCGTDMDTLNLPAETISALRALWESLFTPSQTTPKYDEINAAAKLAVEAFGLAPADAARLKATASGWCLLTLLANAAAKQFPERAAEFYQAKTALLYTAICHARMAVGGDWWATPHQYGDYADTVVYIESSFARFAFHCRKDDPKLAWVLKDAPTSERGWSGRSHQPYAVQLVEGFLSGPETAAEIIARCQAAEAAA